MTLYVEMKPCHLTPLILNVYGNWIPPVPGYMYSGSNIFINGKMSTYDGVMFLASDYKYAYAYYDGKRIYFRVTNISSKPIKEGNVNKVKEWHRLTKQINKLKAERHQLLGGKHGRQ